MHKNGRKIWWCEKIVVPLLAKGEKNMREFYFEDKENSKFVTGILPKDDINCDPYDYFIYLYAEALANLRINLARNEEKANVLDESLIRDVTLSEIKWKNEEILAHSHLNKKLKQILDDVELTKSEQKKILRDITINGADILWFNKKAQELGYKLDIYHLETIPSVYDHKQKPVLFMEHKDGVVEKIGETNMSDGQLKAILDQRKVIQARIYHKDSIWHCFYYTFRGLNGQEPGDLGSKPHYHYLSNKFGMSIEDLLERIKLNNAPSGVHVL